MKSTALRFAWIPSLVLLALVLPFTLSADTIYTATYSGTNEVPPNGSTATGNITVKLSGDLLSVMLSFTGLSTLATAAHLHCCAPAGTNQGVAVAFSGFPNTVAGTYANSFDLTLISTYTASFFAANGGTAASAEAALIAALNSSQVYANIHDSTFPGGEIRGQLTPVPEPSSLLMLFSGLLGGIGVARRNLKR